MRRRRPPDRNHRTGPAPASVRVAAILVLGLGLFVGPGTGARAQTETPSPSPSPAAATAPGLNAGLGAFPAEVDARTPRRAWTAFLQAARAEDFATASHLLDLSEIPAEQQSILGTDSARKLYLILRRVGTPEPARQPDETDPIPIPGSPTGTWPLHASHESWRGTRFESRGLTGSVVLDRVIDPSSGQPRWMVGKGTVAAVAGWAAQILGGPADVQEPDRPLNEALGSPPPGLDRSTPRRTMRTFLQTTGEGDFGAAAHLLWLDHLAPEVQPELGEVLARQLKFIFDEALPIRLEEISDEPFGKPELSPVPPEEDQIGEIPVRGLACPIRIRRVRRPGLDPVWVIAPVTMKSVPLLYQEHGLGWIGESMPAILIRNRMGKLELWQVLGLVVLALLSVLLAILIRRALFPLVRALLRWTRPTWDESVLESLSGPVLAMMVTGFAWVGSHRVLLGRTAEGLFPQVIYLFGLLTIAWFLLRMVTVLADAFHHVLTRDVQDAATRRSIRTRVDVIRQVVRIIVGAVALAYLLMQFETVRAIGTGLLASAGLAGLVIGLAAQKTLSNIFSGLQLGITQPVRLGDEVVFENEWGWIEEITLTHVVIRIWDLRRLVVPIPYLLDRPIQNWTHRSTDIIGTVFFHTDYTVDVQALRERYRQILESTPLWDRRCPPVIQVTDLKDRTLEIRALASAATAGEAWELRCHVREKLLEVLQEHHGRWLPVSRIDLRGAGAVDPHGWAGPSTGR